MTSASSRGERPVDERSELQGAALRAVAELYGVQTGHLDGFDREVHPSAEVLTSVLRSLGAPLDVPGDAGAALQARREELRRRLVEPVTVAWEGASVVLRRGPSLVPGERVEVRVITESGQAREGYVQVTERGIPLAGRLPRGYHLAQVEGRSGSGSCLVISAPERAFGSWGGEGREGADQADEGAREWGVFLPLHALRSMRDRGTGDLTDLERLMDWTGELGGRAVGTLPLLAAFLDGPVEPSPYAPASRLFWNELYLDPTRLPEWTEAPAAREMGRSEAFQARLRRLREAGAVDFEEAYRMQSQLLDPLVRVWWDGPGRRSPEFQAFVQARPHVEGYAAYRAALFRSGGRRDGWPEQWRAGGLPSEALDPEVYRRHLFAQFRFAHQLQALGAGGDGQRAGLYLDLPLGAHALSWDVWANPGLFSAGPSLGAPPDGFHEEGQRWGLPPMRPEASRTEGHEHFRRILGHLLPHARYLRIDHVMGLHRLYWVPRGASAREGAYVRYPAEELYAILCLESHRHRTVIVGEDLGTVPDQVRREMDHRGLRRMYVVPFELRPGAEGDEEDAPGEREADSGGAGPGSGAPGLHPVPRGAVASLNTHDLPTFATAWNEEVLRRCLRAIARAYDTVATPSGEDAAEGDDRDEDWPEALRVLGGVLRWLGLGPAGLVLVNLEDLWLEPRPQNVPGAADPLNWRRRARPPLERFTTDQLVLACLEALDEARARGRGPPPEWRSEPETEPEPRDKPTSEAEPMAEPEPEAETAPAPDEAPKPETAPAPDEAPKPEAAPEPERAPEPEVEPEPEAPSPAVTGLGEQDLYLFNEGTHTRLYDKLGAHLTSLDGRDGTRFAVWAPNAEAVSVVGDFNGWDRAAHPLEPRADSGIWEGFAPGVKKGALYKYHIRSRQQGFQVQKADPFGVRHEEPPRTASVVWDLEYEWGDADWMRERAARNAADAPMSVYEVHLGSWRRDPAEPDRFRSYREIAPELAAYAREMGFTHVELLPVMEHPFYGSWGYQTTGYFAPTARYGTPQDFMYLVDVLHQHGIGVILDWVPSHFPSDEHGLAYFDGTHLYEHADPRKGFHPDWESLIFNYGRNEVRSFLLSSALFWLDRYHVDGLRVDAVASMLYLDYSRKEGEWIPNRHGGRENLEAIDFLRRLNEEVYAAHPDVQTVAEESTAWPMVSRPTYVGGLGFGMKWDMGWMHDTLKYLARDPIHRRHHHDELTFRGVYAFNENFMLPLSHDEVVHGKGSLLGRMPGDDWQKRANLRLLFAYQSTQPGKKLLFMGGELAQPGEWNHDEGLPWELLDQPGHEGVRRLVRDLNGLVRREPALYRGDFDPDGFRWIDTHDRGKSVLSYMRRDPQGEGDVVVAVFNFTPVVRYNYRVGVPGGGQWTEVLNTDAEAYGGTGVGNLGAVAAHPVGAHGHHHSVVLALPPLGAVILKGREGGR